LLKVDAAILIEIEVPADYFIMTGCFRKSLPTRVRIGYCNNYLLQMYSNNIIFQFPVTYVDTDTNIVCLGAASSFLCISHYEEALEQTAYLPSPTVFFTENVFVFQHKADTLSVIGF